MLHRITIDLSFIPFNWKLHAMFYKRTGFDVHVGPVYFGVGW